MNDENITTNSELDTSSKDSFNRNLEDRNLSFEVPKFNEIVEQPEENPEILEEEKYNYENEFDEVKPETDHRSDQNPLWVDVLLNN